jgi:hypothetical protein
MRLFGYQKRSWLIAMSLTVIGFGSYLMAQKARERNLLGCVADLSVGTLRGEPQCSLDAESQHILSESSKFETRRFGVLKVRSWPRVYLDWTLRSGYIQIQWHRSSARGTTEYRFIGSKLIGAPRTQFSSASTISPNPDSNGQ